MCRKECISEKRKHISTYEGLKQLLRDTNYLLTGMRGLSLTREGRDEWEDVMAYVNEHLTEMEEAKRQRLECFMVNLRKGLRNFPLTVVPASVNAIGRDVVALRKTTSQLLDELEQKGIIAAYLDATDEDSDEDEAAERTAQLADNIPGALRDYMDEVYALQYNLGPDDSAPDTGDEETTDDEEMGDVAEDDGIDRVDGAEGVDTNDATNTDIGLAEVSRMTEPGRDNLSVTRGIPPDQIDPGVSRSRRYSWIGRNETQHWTWRGSDDLNMENVQMDLENDDLPTDNDDERAMRLLRRRVQETYDSVMHNRSHRST